MTPALTPRYNEQGLVPAIVQDSQTREVLMMAWVNAGAYHLTCQTGQAHFWSRSRSSLWLKGETSGNIMTVVEMRIDCDEDTLLLLVRPAGPACHTGNISCFYRQIPEEENHDS
jgi:phosphoribosyl-AMP cyclohydrolase